MLMLLAALLDQSLEAPLPMDGPSSFDMIASLPGFSRADFMASPNKALRLGITVDHKGKVRRCDVIESTGAEAVDRKACSLVKSYMLVPAPIGADGKANFGRFEAPLTLTSPEPKSRQPLVTLFRFEDYPKEALAKRESGTVVYDFSIAPDGRVSDCIVTESSGSTSLDRVTCEIIRQRARFKPTLDADGKAIVSHETGKVRWNLPH